MPIDHWNSSVGTYQNRYWVDDKHYKPGGPVFVYDAGETSADVFVQSQFKKPSILQQLLKEFHGMGIIWEHRYVDNAGGVCLTQADTMAIRCPFQSAMTRHQSTCNISPLNKLSLISLTSPKLSAVVTAIDMT